MILELRAKSDVAVSFESAVDSLHIQLFHFRGNSL